MKKKAKKLISILMTVALLASVGAPAISAHADSEEGADSVETAIQTVDIDDSMGDDSITEIMNLSIENENSDDNKYVVVLDPGHGGSKTGTYREYEDFVIDEAVINFKISQYTLDALAEYPEIQVYMTKTTQNENPGITARVTFAVEKNADLFVSQHINATSADRTTAEGVLAMVPTVDETHAFHKEIALLAQKLARKILDKLVGIGFDDDGFLYRLSGDNTRYEDGSLADYYGIVRLCRENNLPGTIIEHGFANNEHDALMLSADENLQKIGEADARGIVDYLIENEGFVPSADEESGMDESLTASFEYTLNKANRTVTLTRYIGTETVIEIPKSYVVKGVSYQTVLDSASLFKGNSTITSVTIDEGVTYKDNAMSYLFSECSKLTSVDLSAVDTTAVTDMSYMFYKCSALSAVDLTGLDTENVTTMRGMFSYCTKLTSLDGYEDWDTGSLVDMYHMFNRVASAAGSATLACIDISNWDLDQVKNTGWCFQLCYAEQILLPDNLAVMSAGFLNHATKVTGTSFTIPAGVKKIGYGHTIYDFATNDFVEFIVAEGNTNYKTVDGILYSADGTEMLAVPRNKAFENGTYQIPEGVDFLGELSFSRNYNIHTLVLPDSYEIYYVPVNDPEYIVFEDKGNLNAGTNLSIAIYCYTGITEYQVKKSNPRYTSRDGIIYSKDMKEVVAVPARYAQEIQIPEGVTTWNREAMWADFENNSERTLAGLLSNCSGVTIPLTLKEMADDQLQMLNLLCEMRAGTDNPFVITIAEGNCWFVLDDEGKLMMVDVVSHVEVTDEAIEPSCTEDGLTEGKHCSKCGEILIAQEVIPANGHKSELQGVIVATCTTEGYSGDEACTVCKATVKIGTTVAKTAHSWNEGVITTPATASKPGVKTYTCTVCKETKTDSVAFEGFDVERIWGKSRYKTSVAIADELKRQLGISEFNTVIIANGANFPDALAGSYLATKKNAPILMVRENAGDIALVESYITSNVKTGGKVYVLGGTAAVPETIEKSLRSRGYNVERLKGKGRYDTNLEILKEAEVSQEALLVCTGTNFADSLSGSATGLPILLVNPSTNKLTEAQIDFLDDQKRQIYIIGGSGAVSDAYLNVLATYDSDGTVERVKGKSRYETSVEVAKKFCGNPTSIVVASAQNFPDGLCGGPLAYVMGAPLVLTHPTVDENKIEPAKKYVSEKSVIAGKVLGGEGALADQTIKSIFCMSAEDQITGSGYE